MNTALPALTGTEKQISWAESIRQAAIPEIEAAAAKLVESAGDYDDLSEPAISELRAAINGLAAELLAREAASDWIDTRNVHYLTWMMNELDRNCATRMPTVAAELAANGYGLY